VEDPADDFVHLVAGFGAGDVALLGQLAGEFFAFHVGYKLAQERVGELVKRRYVLGWKANIPVGPEAPA
jgi:hypothetical protein